MAGDDTTAATSLSEEGEFLKSSWELTLAGPEGVRRFPLYRTVLKMGPLRFTWLGGHLFFNAESGQVIHRREPVTSGELHPGETLVWDDQVVTLHDRAGQTRATLECYTDPFYARIWPIDQRHSRIGRPGKRDNEILINHPTISREHASLSWDPPGPSLRCDSPTATVLVEGQKLSAGEMRNLEDGALVQLGDLLFQFRLLSQPGPEANPVPRQLYVTSLGSFQVRLGKDYITEKSWRTQAVRWLLARLALEWGRAVPVEVLLDDFWPEMSEDKSRNNLNYTISTLRQVLRGNQEPDPILRATGTLQLNPHLLADHDVVRLQQALLRGWQNPQLAPAAYREALDLYAGPYLPGCYLDWAVQCRQRLEQQILQAGLVLLETYHHDGLHAEVLTVGHKLLEIDPTCQQSCRGLMRAHLSRRNAAEALRVYEKFRDTLEREFNLPPTADLTDEYLRAQSLLS